MSLIRRRAAQRAVRLATGATRDRGFTLVELTIAIAVVAIVSASISGAIVTLLRSNPVISSSVTDSNNQNRLLNYFYQDVRATSTVGLDTAAGSIGCTAADSGQNVLRLTWPSQNPTTQAVIVNRASYRLVAETPKSARLDRYFCSGTSETTLGPPTISRIARDLDPVPAGWSAGKAPVNVLRIDSPSSTTVQMALSKGGRIATVQATLDSTIAVPLTAPAPTTSAVASNTAAVNPVAAARSFAVLTEGNAVVKTDGVQGAVAVGGSLTFDNYQNVAASGSSTFKVAAEAEATNLVVGGSIGFTGSGGRLSVGSGFAHVGSMSGALIQSYPSTIHLVPVGTSTSNDYSTPRVVISANQTDQVAAPVLRAGAFPFAASFTTLRTNATKMSALTSATCPAIAEAVVTEAYGNYTITLVNGKVNVLSLTMAQVNAMGNVTSPSSPSDTTPLVINITDGASVSFPTRYWGTLQNGVKSAILWNFANATSVTFSSAFYGTLFAPNAAVNATSMQVDGDIIAKSLVTSGGTIATNHFASEVPCLG